MNKMLWRRIEEGEVIGRLVAGGGVEVGLEAYVGVHQGVLSRGWAVRGGEPLAAFQSFPQ